MKVLITNLMMLADEERFVSILRDRGFDPVVARPKQFFDEEACLDLVGDIDGWLAGDDQITAGVIDKALPKLRVVSKWGTGLDSIDLAAAKSRGLPVCNTPAAFKDAVAEIALGFMLELARGVARTDNAVRQGDWPKLAMPGLIGKSVGIIGFGAIGRGIALRAAAFGMTVNFYDPYYTNTPIDEFEQKSELEDLLVSADYACLACNMSDENFHLIDADELSQMPRGASLINVARGPLVNEAALCEALSSGHLGGAGLDVFEHEPLPESSELRRFENVVLGSHNANNVVSVVEAVHQNTLENLYKYF